jgi:cytochrome P450/glutathione S-transferase
MACWYELTSVRISPFCELTRWVLERAGIAYKEAGHAPIWNVPFTQIAAKTVNVPAILTPDTAFEALPFLEYLDARLRDSDKLYPSDPEQRRQVVSMVNDFFANLAIWVRLYAYANMLPNSKVTGALMTDQAPWWEKAFVRLLYPAQAWAMRKVLLITPASTEKARQDILAAFQSISARLQPGQRYLVGGILTAADLTFAAVTAPITLPPEYGAPFPKMSDLPAEMQTTALAVRQTAAGQLALALYRDHRKPAFPFAATSASAGERLSDRLSRWFGEVAANPRLLRAGFGALRALRPVWKFGKTVMVTRNADVVEMLNRDQDFTIAEINAANMNLISGPFILGMDRSAQYDHEAGAIRAVVKPGDLEWVRQIVRTNARALIDAARPNGRIDVCGNYCRIVAARVVSEYLGVPGPTEHVLMQWLRSLFWEVFENRNHDALVTRASANSAADLRAYLIALIAQRKREPAGDDLLTRLIRAQTLDDDGVRRNITGIIVGAIDTTVTATAQGFDELLRNPSALDQTRAAAKAGDAALLQSCAYEAMRFNPQAPALLRRSHAETTLSSGAKIPANSDVLPLTLSAMFDAKAFPNPGRFVTGRPLDSYLHFGHGMHICYGRLINGVQIPELMGALLLEPNLRRASGRYRHVMYEGPFPDRLVVEFG